MLKTAAGPDGTFVAGVTVVIGDEVACAWIAAGAAVPVEPSAAVPVAPAAETGGLADPEPELQAPESSDEDFHALTKAELVQVAKARGVDAAGTKAELVERLEAAAE